MKLFNLFFNLFWNFKKNRYFKETLEILDRFLIFKKTRYFFKSGILKDLKFKDYGTFTSWNTLNYGIVISIGDKQKGKFIN